MAGRMAFVDALRALNTMKAEGVVVEYAIAGAMALVFWTEPVPTFDKRRERAAMLLDLPSLNRGLVDDILGRYGLSF
jgi:hypothetical protein